MDNGESIEFELVNGSDSKKLKFTYQDASGGGVTLSGSSGLNFSDFDEIVHFSGNQQYSFEEEHFNSGFLLTGDTISYKYDDNSITKFTIGSMLVDTTPTGNICFLGDTKVKTDQGSIAFKDLTKNHSIGGQKIKKIIKMWNSDDNMIFIRKHALSKHVPNKNTYISRNHGVYLPGGKFVRARNLVNGKTIIEHRRKNTLLYNVLMPTYAKMNVNGIICETLNDKDPSVLKYL